ncbi:uncharacterized protein E0L32_000704 [Thyridium curvatum]|uniref:SnoaL-like domain-containing protein n=1 Tax=Thyridium curvatum TaxID=1093900 RepID=A0A507AYC8_9PEZI|nr:uncharacterized protein E0L32_000704 [Thyridium curvatum]TPX12527.1 hypothetical protein E0L32_000704 [Thyridium curvatum]
MGYNTQDTVWPEHPVPDAVKVLIDRFFNLLDSHDSNVGNILADEIFASDAEAHFGNAAFTGSDEIRKSRDNAWKLFNTRKHTVLRVFSANKEANDLLFIAWVAMDLKNGEHVAGEFIGRLRFDNARSSNPKIKQYNHWADSAPLVKAMQKK